MIGITTKFQGLSDNELYKMYRIEEWKEMNEGDKQQLLQETVVRSAEKRGEVGCCIVNFEDLPDGTLGTHRNGVISLNRSHYAVGAENIEYKGKIITREIPAVNLDALETEMVNGIRAGNYEESYDHYTHINNMDDCVDCVKYADTIVEADTEGEQK